jgi:biopolymer transport protein ExbD
MSRRNRREYLVPDLTPLIDVVFLLLIFFMVSSVFKKEELALLLNLPKTEQGKTQATQKTVVTIEIDEKKIAFEGKEITLAELTDKVTPLSKKTLINLRVDGTVRYERLVDILDLLQKNKLENLSLITVRKGK